MIDEMNILLDEFDLRLPNMYSHKDIVPVVHAVSHLAECVARAGPMSNWNTFSFESVVGKQNEISLLGKYDVCLIGSFARNINSAKAIGTELKNSLELLHQGWLAVSSTSFPAVGKHFIKQMLANNHQALPSSLRNGSDRNSSVRLRNKTVATHDLDVLLAQRWTPHSYTIYNTAFINNIRFSNKVDAFNNTINDSCLLYKMSASRNLFVGFLNCIVQLKVNNDVLFIIKQVSITSHADQMVIDGQILRCNNVMFGKITKPIVYHMIRTSNIIEKLGFQYENSQSNATNPSYIFFRYPNFRTNT
ncbi:unnamed protein product [Rotaria sp. Silwood1]|nr:unnamed protein product [Rotaria sp. Silwood1]